MIIVALLGAMFFYMVIFLIFTSTQTPLNTLGAWLGAFEAMLWQPTHTVFSLARFAISLGIIYVVGDMFLSSSKQMHRRRKEKKRAASEPFEVTIKDDKRR